MATSSNFSFLAEHDPVFLDRGVWLLHGDDTKNGKTRRIALSGALVALLQAQSSRGVSEWVFPGRDGPAKPINNLTKPFNRMLKAAGLEKARVHDLRHTHASMLLASGVDAVVVKNALGHSSLNVTSRYLHLVDTSLKSASEAMARVVGRAAGAEVAAGEAQVEGSTGGLGVVKAV